MALARDAQHIPAIGEPLAGGRDEEVFAAFAVELEQTEWQGRVHALQEGRQVYGLHLTRCPFLAGATWRGAALCREVDRRILCLARAPSHANVVVVFVRDGSVQRHDAGLSAMTGSRHTQRREREYRDGLKTK
jgi:hypothetical protein